MLGWIFIAVLGIIWGAFLLPYLRRGGSPTTSVEEFERKMDVLEQTHSTPRGRWVLTPRKGERFLGRRDRTRSRMRHRRRQVFALLWEAALLTLLIGLFPPFHAMLMATAIIVGLLFVYSVLLARLRVVETSRARAARSARARARAQAQAPVHASPGGSRGRAVSAGRSAHPPVDGDGYGVYGYGQHRDVSVTSVGRNGSDRGYRANRNGYAPRFQDDRMLREAGIQIVDDPRDEIGAIMDDDVHVIVHRSDETDARAAGAAAR